MSENAFDTLLGCGIIVCGVGLLTYLVWWSFRTINRIANHRHGSIRQIVKDLNDERQA